MQTRRDLGRFEVWLIVVVFLFAAHLPSVFAEAGNRLEHDDSPVPELPDWLEFDVQLELEMTREHNYDLEPNLNDTRELMRPELQLETHVQVLEHVEGLLLLEFSREFAIQDDTDRDEPDHVEFLVKEVYVKLDELFDTSLSIQVGRQDFEDERQWLYDHELDAIRLRYRIAKFRFEASLARVALLDRDLIHGEGREDTDYYHLYAQYEAGASFTLAAYGLVQDENMPEGEQLAFFGLRARGVLELDRSERLGLGYWPNFYYWIDIAHIRGKSEGRRVSGWGLDVGFISTFDHPSRLSIMLAYAFGSGDDSEGEGMDTAFRQPGLHGNGGELGGFTDVQYYGELLDPELSNLHIFTAGLGFRPIERVSFMVLHHVYRQDVRSDAFRDVDISAEPTGLSRDIGRELDFITGWTSDEIELKLAFGVFLPGRAFPAETDRAYFAQFTFTVGF